MGNQLGVARICLRRVLPSPSRWRVARDAWHAVEVGVVAGEVGQSLVLHYRHDESIARQ